MMKNEETHKSTPHVNLDNDSVKLRKIEQAAIILLGLGEEYAGKVMQNFTRREFEQVAHAMSKLSGIQVDQAKETITDFFDEFRQHSGIQGASKQFLDSMLNSALGNNIGKGLVADLYGDEIREKMQQLQWIPVHQIFQTIQNEHKKVICAFLAYLPADTSSQVLQLFESEKRSNLLYAISQIEGLDQNVADDLLRLIDLCAHDFTANKAASVQGTKQVADILNRMSGDKAELMSVIKARDTDTFNKIQENMFDFYLLLNQIEDVIETLHEYINLERWAIALKGTDRELKAKIFNSLTKRQLKELHELMESKGSVGKSTAEKARHDIMEELRRLNNDGEISLVLYKEVEVD